MCEVWDRRKALDVYEAVVAGIASRIEGTAFCEYCMAFGTQSSALIQQHNSKLDWGFGRMGYFACYS